MKGKLDVENIDEGGGLLSRDGNEVDLDDGWGSGEG